MTGRLVWVPEGAKHHMYTFNPEIGEYVYWAGTLPSPTAAGIDVLVTAPAARAAQISLIASGVAKWVERDDAAMAIKAALRELLGVKP